MVSLFPVSCDKFSCTFCRVPIPGQDQIALTFLWLLGSETGVLFIKQTLFGGTIVSQGRCFLRREKRGFQSVAVSLVAQLG